MIPRPPTIPASLAALVMLGGLGLMYWSLTGLGLIKPATAPVVTAASTAPTVGGFGGGSGGGGGGGAGGGF